MTVDEYLVWAEGKTRRAELYDGRVVFMSAERASHAITKANAFIALKSAIARSRVPCRAMPDGMTVRINERSAFEPDALVYCGPRLSNDAIEVPDPVVVVEVLSPGTRSTDFQKKLAGYLSLKSLRHYLIIDPDAPLVVHHERLADGAILTHLVQAEGAIRLDPPGIEITMAEIYPPDEFAPKADV